MINLLVNQRDVNNFLNIQKKEIQGQFQGRWTGLQILYFCGMNGSGEAGKLASW